MADTLIQITRGGAFPASVRAGWKARSSTRAMRVSVAYLVVAMSDASATSSAGLPPIVSLALLGQTSSHLLTILPPQT